NYGSAVHYEPNSFGEWQENPSAKEPPLEMEGTAYAHNFRDYDEDDYSQPGDLFRIIKADGKSDLLFQNTAAQVGGAEKVIQIRHLLNCCNGDPEYGTGVSNALGLTVEEVDNFDMTPYHRYAPKPGR